MNSFSGTLGMSEAKRESPSSGMWSVLLRYVSMFARAWGPLGSCDLGFREGEPGSFLIVTNSILFSLVFLVMRPLACNLLDYLYEFRSGSSHETS